MLQKGFSKITILIIGLAVLASAAILTWQYWQMNKNTIFSPGASPFNQKESESAKASSTIPEAVKPPSGGSNEKLSLEMLKNMEYQLFECPTSSDNDDNDPDLRYYYLYKKAICKVKLEDGEYDFYEKISERPGLYESAYEPGFVVVFSGATFADLNNDNINDALVTLRAFAGGTGNTTYLAAVIIAGDEYRNVDTITIPGDRAGVEITSIKEGIITIYSPLWYELYANVLKISFSEEKGFEIIERKTVPQG